MPRVPAYQPNQVAPAETTGARFRAANNNGGVFGAVGEGLEGFGRTVGAAVEFQDRINEENDDTQARLLSAEAASAYSTATSEYQALSAGAAREAQGTYNERLDSIRDTVLSRAGNPRQREFLEQRLAGLHAAGTSQIATHAVREQKAERTAAFGSQISSYAEMAATATDPLVRDQAIASAVAVRRDQLIDDGMLPDAVPELFALEEQKITTQVHAAVIDRMFAVPDPDVDEVMGYIDAYGDEMTAALQNQTLERLQQPLQGRVARSDADLVMALAMPQGDAVQATTAPTAAPATAVALLRDFEGFREGTYWDVDHHRVGYGSDTITTASGQVREVRQGDRVSREDAERDLARRTADLARTAANKAGEGWQQLPEGARAAVISVAYNYGEGHERLKPLWSAAARGDAGAVASVIESFANDNNGVNRSRRLQEAEAARGGGAYTNTPRQWDRAQIYQNLEQTAERERWNPERVERTREEIDRRIQRDEGMLREVQADADEAATAILEQKGEAFRTHMIPRDVWNDMTPTQRMQYEEIETRLKTPVAPPADSARAMELRLMRIYEPERFKELNLTKEVGTVTNDELSGFLTQQATMRTEAPDAWNPRSGITTALNYGKRINQMELEPAQEAAVLQIMEAEAQRLYRQNGNKALTEDDYQTLFRSATRNVTTRTSVLGISTGTNERPRYELTLDMMPNSTRERLTQRAQRTLGRAPTDEELLRLYRLEQ